MAEEVKVLAVADPSKQVSHQCIEILVFHSNVAASKKYVYSTCTCI